jgi:WD40 repeat protein
MNRLLLFAVALALTGCVARTTKAPVAPELRPAPLQLSEGYSAAVVAEGLTNPSFVSFRPGSGNLTICDSGKGRVVMIEDGRQVTIVEGLDTEFWKTLPSGVKAYKVGVQAALWLSPQRLIVTDGGKPDGSETVVVYHISSEGPGHNSEKVRTNTIGPTGGGDADKGEGNFSGITLMPDGRTLYVCSHGNDKKSWVLKGDLKDGKLETALSADDNGITVNAPMQALEWNRNLLVVYSGAGGVDDGLIVEWDLASGKPLRQWKMTGMMDPMGIARLPGSDNRFAVTNNNWRIDGVNLGTVAIVTLGDNPQAETKVIARGLLGPVHCAFGPDGRLYVSCLGAEYDKDEGLVVAISGFSD